MNSLLPSPVARKQLTRWAIAWWVLSGVMQAAQPAANTLPGRSFEDSLTLHRWRSGLTNVNGVAYIAVTRRELGDDPSQLRIDAAKLNHASLDVGRTGPRVIGAHIFVDTGCLPLRVQQSAGTSLNLKIGTMVVPRQAGDSSDTGNMPRLNQQDATLGVVTNGSGGRLKEVSISVKSMGVEVVR
ncbi:MAG: hypothetical protein JNK85_24190 [Verrucomicrobiales bacterium]|nr:hypothetical protein [Verrucomicrobiales bacterium]